MVQVLGFTILGPGSEWFWAMAQLIVITVTLIAIYRQVKAQGAANAFARISLLEDTWRSRPMTLARLRAAIRLRYEQVDRLDAAAMEVANFLENLAILERDGHLTLGEIDDTWGTSLQIWWAFLAPVVAAQRTADANPRMYGGIERLAVRLREVDVKQVGHGIDLTPENVPAWLEQQIHRATAALELMNDAENRAIPDVPSVSAEAAATGEA